METELSFLLNLLLEHKLPKATKDLVKERIKVIQQPVTSMHRMVTSQPTAAPTNLEALPMPARIQGGEVTTGPGTKGPRKW